MAIEIRQQLIVDIGEKSYTLTQLNASLAYQYLGKIRKQAEGIEMSPEEVKNLIVESTGMSRDKYEKEFSGKMLSMFKLVEEIIEFNYADVFQQDVSEEPAQE